MRSAQNQLWFFFNSGESKLLISHVTSYIQYIPENFQTPRNIKLSHYNIIFVSITGSDEEEGEPEEQSRSDDDGDRSNDEVDNITNAGSISELLERAHGDIGDALRPTASSTNIQTRKRGNDEQK